MSIGKEIKILYEEMLKIFSETSHFIAVVNDLFVSSGWKPVGGNAVMWDRSNHYSYPQFWMPYFQQRIFTLGEDSTHAVGINILFDEPYGNIKNTIPFISCIYITMDKKHAIGKSNEIYSAGWHEHSIRFTDDHPKLYQTIHPEFTTLVNYFLPLDVISNQEAVKKYIIHPLLLLYKGQFDDGYEAIKLVCLSKEELSS